MEIKEIALKDLDLDSARHRAYLTGDWLGAYGSNLRLFSVSKGATPKAYFNVFIYTKAGMKFLITPPYAPHIGVVFTETPPSGAKRNNLLSKTAQSMAQYLKENFPKTYIDLILPSYFQEVQPFESAGFELGFNYTHLLDISQKPDDILSGFAYEKRRNIRDAEQKFTIQLNVNPEETISFLDTCLSGSGAKLNTQMLKTFLKAPSAFFNVGVLENEKLRAATIIGQSGSAAHYILGSADKSKEATGAGPLSVWASILEARQRELKTFDFMGSSIPGVAQYFKDFGAEVQPLFRVKRNHKLMDLAKTIKNKIKP